MIYSVEYLIDQVHLEPLPTYNRDPSFVSERLVMHPVLAVTRISNPSRVPDLARWNTHRHDVHKTALSLPKILNLGIITNRMSFLIFYKTGHSMTFDGCHKYGNAERRVRGSGLHAEVARAAQNQTDNSCRSFSGWLCGERDVNGHSR